MKQTQNENLEAALSYAKRGWRVVPFNTVMKDGKCSCSPKGKCPTKIGKHPRITEWEKDASTEEAQIKKWWRLWPDANVGILAGHDSGLVVLDIDNYHGGDDSLRELEKLHGELPFTVESITGSGGRHILFKHPGKYITSSPGKLGSGIDIRADKSCFVAPPSNHISGDRYHWEVTHNPDDDIPIADLPGWLLDLMLSGNGKKEGVKAGESIPEGERNDRLFRLGCSMRRNDFDEDDIFEALKSVNDKRCHPPLDESELILIASQAARYEPNKSFDPYQNGRRPYLYDYKSVVVETSDSNDPMHQPWRNGLDLTKKEGKPKSNIGNIALFLENHPRFEGWFWYDAVRLLPMVKDAPLNDEIVLEIAEWLGVYEGLSSSNIPLFERSIIKRCKNNSRDLLQIWLNELPPWDKVQRLDEWLIDVAEVEKTAYGMAVSRILPLSMVARAMNPGCHYRYVVILQGEENTGKSKLVRELATTEWFREFTIGLDSKDAKILLQGAWVAEFAELDSLSRSEETKLKAFITESHDSWVPKYSNFVKTSPRRTVLIGTTNDNSFLKGDTGNTRFLPIKTGNIYPERLKAMRDQLFAEALYVYNGNHDTWWDIGAEALEEAVAQREERRQFIVYEEKMLEWEPMQPNAITWKNIAEDFFDPPLPPDRWKDKLLQMQIAQALKAVGRERKTAWIDGRAQKAWVRAGRSESELDLSI